MGGCGEIIQNGEIVTGIVFAGIVEDEGREGEEYWHGSKFDTR